IRNAAGKIFVEAELEVHSRIKRPGRFFEQPATPVRILFPNLADFRTTAPAWAVVVPNDLDLADLPERAGLDKIADGDLIRFAAMLRSDLRDAFVFEYGVAGGLGLLQVIGHRFFAIAIFASLGHEFEMGRVLEVGGRDQHGVHVFEREHLLHVLEGARLLAVIFGRLRRRRLAVDLPEIANGGHLHVLFFQLRDNPGQLLATTSHSDMAERDPIVGAQDTIVGGSGGAERARANNQRGGLINKRSAVDLLRKFHRCLQESITVGMLAATVYHKSIDAAETLAKFMVDGSPDPDR